MPGTPPIIVRFDDAREQFFGPILSAAIQLQIDFGDGKAIHSLLQEVEQAANDCGYDFSGLNKPQTPGGLYGLGYTTFVVPLVKSVQELNDSLQAVNKSLQAKLNKLSSVNSSQTTEIGDLKKIQAKDEADIAELKKMVNSMMRVQASTK